MGTSTNGTNAMNGVGNYVNSSLNRNLTNVAVGNPLGLGGNRVTKFVSDPLGLFGGGGKKVPIYSTDANGNPLIGGQPYDPNKIYTNPNKAEAARQVAIRQGTASVNSVFDSPEREAQRQKFLDALRTFYTGDANRKKAVADRNRTFSMARSGLSGGSADSDSRRLLGEEYSRGLLDAENRAQGAYSDLQGQDEAARLDMLGQVRQGMDATSAASRSAAVMSSNAGAAQAKAMSEGLGDIFGDTAANYQKQNDAAQRRRGIIDAYG